MAERSLRFSRSCLVYLSERIELRPTALYCVIVMPAVQKA